MNEFRVLVIGENCEAQMKGQTQMISSFQKSNWLFDGALEREDLSQNEVVNAILANPKLIPEAVIDNGKWFNAEKLGQNPESWKKTLESILTSSGNQSISCFTCQKA